MTAPVPPGRVHAPPLTAAEAAIVARFDAAPDLDLAAEARQETVARAIWDADWCADDSSVTWETDIESNRRDYRVLAAAAIAADDAWRAEQAGGGDDCPTPCDDCPGWRPGCHAAALAPADHEPAAAIGRVLALADELVPRLPTFARIGDTPGDLPR
jgi:hypothetical protein